MIKLIQKILGDKKEYKEQIERAQRLPEDYKFVFEKIHGYIWSFAGGDGSDMLKAQQVLIELFEESALEGKHVLEVTGKDVAGFCDELIRDTKKWTDYYRKKLKHKILNKAETDNDK